MSVTDRACGANSTRETRNVTDAAWNVDVPTDTRNASAVTDTVSKVDFSTVSRNTWNIRNSWRSEARRWATVCCVCGAAIAADAPVVLGYRDRLPNFHVVSEALACLTCAAPWLERVRPHPESCRHCRRPIYRRRWKGRRFCCDQCAWLAASARRGARAAALRTRRCVSCGQSFTAPRKDAVTCSPACRQKAYRQRKSVTGQHVR